MILSEKCGQAMKFILLFASCSSPAIWSSCQVQTQSSGNKRGIQPVPMTLSSAPKPQPPGLVDPSQVEKDRVEVVGKQSDTGSRNQW